MDPPTLTNDQFEALLAQIADYQLAHGSLLSLPLLRERLDSPVPIARPVGVSVFPTPFPSALFHDALSLQQPMNRLYVQVAGDPEWLGEVLAELRQHDEFVAKLWSIWERVRDEGEVQSLECGVWRSDYMLHACTAGLAKEDRSAVGSGTNPSKERTPREGEPREGEKDAFLNSQLKQVEFNTYSCAGGGHGNIAADMHSRNPPNNTIRDVVQAIEAAHKAYGPPIQGALTAVLMTVQPRNSNTCDERPIEYGLSGCDPPVPLFRVEFNGEVLRHCHLGPGRELLYRAPWASEAVEISVVYQRAGYDACEYDEQGVNARLLLERSRAVKCPSILGHLAGLKKVQQALTRPGALERFVEPDMAEQIREVSMPLRAMDATEDGLAGRRLAIREETAKGYVLKPSLEGGGHNVYGTDITSFLRGIPQEKWANYILMGKINPPVINNVLVSYQEVYYGQVVSELGVFGACLWRRRRVNQEPVILNNTLAGWSFKTKPAGVNEMSVVKGYGCFDCPRLIP
ncbi:hypothetical protein QBC33DRAFT_588607 [Phialemonium atrogriseum]|uniref:Glutathione synthetase n=1 Tax=Phialemonium atrogriseum TaxID=1093897 RepID=A0AAJ0BXT3_9PEZI|nr:uncharacterized protein QBC33DRAFT_588607 [Phialemonium atrogriseum]KAK1766464.1 hypothetical protein QBC33DRAFT_588607 [Phialemonium atrogriseum]